MRKYLIIGIITLIALSSATVGAQQPMLDDWRLVSYRFASMNNINVDERTITLTIDSKAGGVSGNSGCNQYAGKFGFEDTRLKIGPLVGTKMACDGPWMQFERMFTQTLESADSFAFESGVLTFTDAETQSVLRFKRVVKPEIYTWYVNKKVEDCIGVVKTKCLQIKDSKDGAWKNFFGPIAGFEWKKDYYYIIEVERIRRPNPPADASAFEHRLVRIVKQTKKEKEL